MALQRFQVLLVLATVPLHEALFSGGSPVDLSRLRPHFEDNEELLSPKHTHHSIKIVHPVVHSDKYYPFLFGKPAKKPLVGKYIKPTLIGKIPLSETLHLPDVGKAVLQRPLSLHDDFSSLLGGSHLRPQPQFEDIKPVTEIIEGDLKYDFRTKTHSL